ncbi:MAG: pilin [Candidatus Falkowbacteria bacterium]|nr:pilin [Candidatus Falkowbacteria bacterium]
MRRKITKQKLLNLLLAFLIVAPTIILSFSAATNYALAQVDKPLYFQPEISVPGSNFQANATTTMTERSTTYIGQYISAFYNYAMGIVGIVAVIVLMIGGVIWLTSGGNPNKVGQAKDLIVGSITGVALLLGSWILLNTVNPNLVKFKINAVNYIAELRMGCCEYGNNAYKIDNDACKKNGGTFYDPTVDTIYIISGGKCQALKLRCNIKRDCDGNVVWCINNDVKITTKDNCGNYFAPVMKLLYELKDGGCGSQTECSGKTASCTGVKDGEKCEKTGTGKDLSGYCYFSMCYLDTGNEQEPCGLKPGAFCSATLCSNLGQVGKTYYNDTSGGRKCAADLLCCYTE